MKKDYAYIRHMTHDIDLKVDYDFAIALQEGDLVIHKNYGTDSLASWVQEIVEDIPLSPEEIQNIDENQCPVQLIVKARFFVVDILEVWVVFEEERDYDQGIIRFQNSLD